MHAPETSKTKLIWRLITLASVIFLLAVAVYLLVAPMGESKRMEQSLIELRGVGIWTARYTMMRACAFPDCVPVGDAGLSQALVRFFGLTKRPDAQETEKLMARFAPYRSLATCHMWLSLKDAMD